MIYVWKAQRRPGHGSLFATEVSIRGMGSCWVNMYVISTGLTQHSAGYKTEQVANLVASGWCFRAGQGSLLVPEVVNDFSCCFFLSQTLPKYCKYWRLTTPLNLVDCAADSSRSHTVCTVPVPSAENIIHVYLPRCLTALSTRIM